MQLGDLTLLPDGTAFLCNGARVGTPLLQFTPADNTQRMNMKQLHAPGW